ncbi:MAG: hypothetical protein CMF62_02270 [Magnetococcales bacterium]|nr:hypothetical protein [Magnetococcales bacterium]
MSDLYSSQYEILEKEIREMYKNNIPKYLDTILPQLLMMYNESFWLDQSEYKRNWDYSKTQKLFGILKDVLSTEDQKTPPILNLSNEEKTKIAGANTKLQVLNKVTNKVQDEQDDLNYAELIFRLRNLELEKESEIDRNRIDYLNEQIQQLKILIGNRGSKIVDLDQSKTHVNNKLQQLLQERKRELSQVDTFVNSDKNIRIKDISGLYDNIFFYYVNNQPIIEDFEFKNDLDFFGYNKLWELMRDNKNKQLNFRNILHPLTIKEGSIIRMITKDPTNKTLLSNAKVISDFYKSIVGPKITNLERLPQFYNNEENPELKKVMDIMIHCVKFTICSNLFLTIVKMISKLVIKSNPEQDSTFLETNINNILNDIPELITFLLTEAPEVLVKVALGIYENEYDQDKDIGDTTNALEPILDIVKKIRRIPISEDSDFYEDLKTQILPYYSTISMKMINTMKVTLDNYNRYLMIKSRHMEILNELI